MKFFIVSYMGGMFGEFFCSLIGENTFFYKPKDHTNITEYKIKNNRWIYPDYLSVVDFHAKTRSSDRSWDFTQYQKDILLSFYKDKNILIPTHWYQKDLINIGLPTQGIRLYCSNKNDLLLSYILFWIKSHVWANQPWPSRIIEIQELISNNHKYSKEFQDLLVEGNYHNWKYLSYRNEWLISGNTDLDHYVMCHWYKNQRINSNLSPNWYNLDIGSLLHSNLHTLEKFEEDFSIKLDRSLIDVYNKENISLVENELGICVQNLSSEWNTALIRYIRKKIN